MHVQVRYGLAGSVLAVDDQPITVLYAQLFRQLGRDDVEIAEQRDIPFGHVSVGGDHLGSRNNQDVHRRLGIDVAESQATVIFVDDVGGDLPVDDLLK